MDNFVDRIRKHFFWKARAQISYTKLPRGIKLPFDERNLFQKPSPDFHQFIIGLLARTHAFDDLGSHLNDLNFNRLGQNVDLFNLVPDETMGFNFIMCRTTDTFWSIAELFKRPYQPLVWTLLLITLFLSIIFLIVAQLLVKLKFSWRKVAMNILWNLVEVGINPGNIHGRKLGLQIVLVSWFLMSIILTNSYKGLMTHHFLSLGTLGPRVRVRLQLLPPNTGF